MIIQCRQCRTKFRFDDAFMQGSGVWLRCSRCGHVYFQENPKKTAADSVPEPEPVVTDEVMPVEEGLKVPSESPSVFYRDKNGGYSPRRMKEPEKPLPAQHFPEKPLPEKPLPEKQLSEEIDWGTQKEPEEEALLPEIEKTEETRESEKTEETKKKTSSGGSGRAWKIALWSMLVILIIPAVIYLYVFPEMGSDLINNLTNKYNEYTENSKPATSGVLINQMVKLQDVRYRRVNNYLLGQIGVVEGIAVNRADYAVSRILIEGEILDAYSVVLSKRTTYAGNILTDEELTNLSEEEILLKLAHPQGINNANDKIMPGGQIPFMIVFPNEPAGVIKATVVTIGAERLL